MLGWILGGIAAAALLSDDHPSTSASNNSYDIAAENRRLYRENETEADAGPFAGEQI